MTSLQDRWAVDDEGRGVTPFDEAYRRLVSRAQAGGAQSETWLPLVYARRSNDRRLARALLAFARERTAPLEGVDAARSVLELADAALDGQLDRDLCSRLAHNLLDEAYARVSEDKRIDRFFGEKCVSSAARLASRVEDPVSLRDAIEVIRSAVAMDAVAGHDCGRAGLGGDPGELQASAREVEQRALAHVRSAGLGLD